MDEIEGFKLYLSVAEGDDQEGALSEETDVLLGMGEEEPPRRAELPWLELPPVDSADRSIVRPEHCDS